ncbi:MAG: hypothetical protein JW836_06730 [Deltaproteobacteria bacterium]|nr:hypothetical protein [Deltaproteobacteria bacterium]
MSRFGKRDATEIIEFLEKELDSVPRLEKIEKMKLRSKIRQQEYWLMAAENPIANRIADKLSGRLAEVFALYPYGFRETLTDLLDEKISQIEKNEPESMV